MGSHRVRHDWSDLAEAAAAAQEKMWRNHQTLFDQKQKQGSWRCEMPGWRLAMDRGWRRHRAFHLLPSCTGLQNSWYKLVVSIHPCKSPFHFSFSGPQMYGLHGPHEPSSFHWVQPMGGNLRRFESRVFIPCSLLWDHRLAVVVPLYQRPRFPLGSFLLKPPHSSCSKGLVTLVCFP